MKETTFADKLNEIIAASRFEIHNGKSDDLTVKSEKVIKSSLRQLIKQEIISEKTSHRLKTTESHPARTFGHAKVH